MSSTRERVSVPRYSALVAGGVLLCFACSGALAGSTAPANKPNVDPAPASPAPSPNTPASGLVPPIAPQPPAPPPGNITVPTQTPSQTPPSSTTDSKAAPAATTPPASSTLPGPNLKTQKAKVKETTLTTGLGLDEGTGKSRRKHAHRREPWPRVNYRTAYYNPYCGPPPTYGVYIVRVR